MVCALNSDPQKKAITLTYDTYEEALRKYRITCEEMAHHLTLINGRISIKLLDFKKPLRELIISSTNFNLL